MLCDDGKDVHDVTREDSLARVSTLNDDDGHGVEYIAIVSTACVYARSLIGSLLGVVDVDKGATAVLPGGGVRE